MEEKVSITQTKQHPKKLFWAGTIGNVLDHYDLALYTFLVPFMAPVFFKQDDPVVALIIGYGLTAVGIVTRPLGAIFFGRLAMHKNPKTLLMITLLGVGLSTFSIAFIPTYSNIGFLSVVLLLFIRIIQGLFAAGEQSIASILLLDKIEEKQRTKISSYYVASSMAGATLASGAATIVGFSSNPEFYWRYAFASGIITCTIGLILRHTVFDFKGAKVTGYTSLYKTLKINKANIIRVMFVGSFSYMTYSIPFVFFNKFIPLITDITFAEMMSYNSLLLILDILLLPVFGHIAQRYDAKKWMKICAIVLGVTIVPAFYILSSSSLYDVLTIKLWIVITGIAFVTPSKVWMYNLIGGKEKYLVTGLGYAIGTEVLGRQTTTICWMLWYATQNPIAPALYVVFLSFVCVLSLV